MITGIGLQIDEMAEQGQFSRRQKTAQLIGLAVKLYKNIGENHVLLEL